MVRFTDAAGIVPHLGREEAEGRGQWYIGPEHLLVGLLRQGDNTAASLLQDHGLDLDTVRAGIDRLVAERVLPGPQPSEAELLATLGIDLDEVLARLKESFGWEAYYYAAQSVRLRPVQPIPHAPLGGTPLTCNRVLGLASGEAAARDDQEVTPLHLLLALLRDAEDPVDAGLSPGERRLRAMLGLPGHGPSPVRLLVEAQGLTLEQLRAAVTAQLDQHP
jgi:ATP-dependent Clp protease ATP-binding subunit ClpA